jgi:endo-1,4-beta-xylanase
MTPCSLSRPSFLSALAPFALVFLAADDGSAAPGGGGGASSGGSTSGSGGSDGTGNANGVGGMGGLSNCADPEKGPWGDPLDAESLGAKYATYFPLGAALGSWHLDNASAASIAETHFNHFTAENSMKVESLQPTEGSFNWAEADKLADFARARGRKITFHTLVWHRQTPSWFFAGLTPGQAESIETLKDRMRLHIEAVVDRYADVVSNWDVVNEAVETNGWRTDSPWYEYFGGPEYVYWAFHYTRQALEAKEPCSSAGRLYYNDYNVNQKVQGILDMAAFVAERGERVDGIGDQAHYRIDWPSVTELRTTYQAFVDAGLKLKVSELDLTVYNDYPPPDYAFEPAEEVAFSGALDTQLATRYAELFGLFREFAPHLTSVTFWGINDDRSWLNNEPVANRENYPLLWNASFEPKAAFEAVRDF